MFALQMELKSINVVRETKVIKSLICKIYLLDNLIGFKV